jgi:predicted O-methyltransferase YrrM
MGGRPLMDVEGFARTLPQLFDDFPRSPRPRDGRFAEVLAATNGLARENNLALLNLAASRLGPGESYVEVGSFRGASLVSAMLGNDGDFVAIDNFAMRDASREAVEANLRRFGCDGATILEADAFEARLDGLRIGVFYWDALHGREAEGLRLVEPNLAERALLIVDDSDWERVRRSVDGYLASQPRARELLAIAGESGGQPQWWEGVRVLAWER